MGDASPRYVAEPLPGTPGRIDMPSEFDPRKLARRAVTVIVILSVVTLVVVLAPGLGEVRDKLEGATPGWLAVAVAFEALSCLSYVAMFRPVFCRNMPWRTSWEIGWSELAMGYVILFWLPLLVGTVTFLSLRRALNRQERPELCVVPSAG